MTDLAAYDAFLRAKAASARPAGEAVTAADINPLLKDHQRAIVEWAVRGGRRAIFAAFGLGKTFMQIEAVECLRRLHGGRGLIVAPLGVRQEFMRDVLTLATGEHPDITDAQRAQLHAWQDGRPERVPSLRFIRRIEEADETGLYITNYETVRDGKLDPRLFDITSLDEASCLRGFGGTKTFREFMKLFAGDDRHAGTKNDGVKYRFVATATPSPNDYIELLAYAAYLGIMDVGEAKTRFFRRNSEKADQLTLHPHKEEEFWLWVSSWAVFLQKPSDLGFSDEGYELPPLTVRYHEVRSDLLSGRETRSGQMQLIADAAVGVVDAAREKRASLPARIAKAAEIKAASPDDHFIFWHDLEAERVALERAIPGIATVYGSQDLEERERVIAGFSDGRISDLGGKPSMLGSGCNFQRHCHRAVFTGIGFKFNDFIQAIHRIQRFLQPREVVIDIIHSENEREVLRNLLAKWEQDKRLREKMGEIIRKYRLNEQAMAEALERSIGVERIEVKGEKYRIVNNDTVIETSRMAENSVGLIVTSIPFSTQYEYTPSYNDFGHTDDDDHFWRQMDFLTPQLLRVLQPGRWACVHVKDRIVPGGINGLGFQTLSTFHADCIHHFRRHGFAFMGMKTITTDVVRENNQTYRLGWTEQCKDATKMGCGVPEYLLLFRKPQTDRSKSYADVPVVKAKKEWDREAGAWKNPGGYSRARWQIDAHAYARSSGDRHLKAEEIAGLPADQVYKIWKEFNLSAIYDFEHHVAIGEALEMRGALPPTFMLLPPHSWHDDVWSDVARMRTLNGEQNAKGREMHLCPLQFDIVERAITQLSNPGDTVFDPFGGLMTVPYCAIRLGRRGLGVELNPGYFLDGAAYCRAMEEKMSVPSLFDYLDAADGDGVEERMPEAAE
ncbi:DNA methyltransferase [Oricola thermophila]|uniref:site-specific DNA-methyltransferase (adenine-specific) n=1 Tax=Oricola thermophila TaxID=2742145 RepID=A0A6N1VDE0_9HYPH|nr:DNA methyltransferase [Oricola thermophila]QKV18738.1 DNA methylase N-4 [Oricola thermophila]